MKNNYFKVFTLIALTCSVLTSFAQTRLQKEQITSRYDKQKIQQLESKFTAQSVLEKQRAIEMARTNNWPLTIEQNGTFAQLQKVTSSWSLPTFHLN